MKDTRIVYDREPVTHAGTIAHFDGKGTKETKTLKVYRFMGDLRIAREALKKFMAKHGYTTLKIYPGVI